MKDRQKASPGIIEPHWFYFLTLVVIGFIFLGSSINGGLLNYDDERYIEQNELISDLSSEHVGRMFTEYFDGHYHPVTLLSLAIDQSLFSDAIRGHHLVNLVLHILNSLLIYLFLFTLFRERWLSFGVALLFLLHPMNVESYAWMTERKNVLYSTFFLASMIAYLKYLRDHSLWLLGLTFGLFTLAILSKAQAMALIPVLFLLDVLKERNARGINLYLEKLPFILVAVVFVVLTTGAQKQAWGELDTTGYDQVQKLALASFAFISYIVRGLVPIGQSAYYPYPQDYGAELGWYIYASIAGGVFFLFFLWYAWRRKEIKIFFGMAFFLINIFLMLKYLDVPYGNYYMANRYNYLPLIGLMLVLLVFIQRAPGIRPSGLYAVLIGFGLIYGWMARTRIEVWSNSINLWTDVVDHYPGYSHALNMRGLGYIAGGRSAEAISDFQELTRVDPDFREAYVNLAVLYFQMNDAGTAGQWTARALEKFPEDDRLYNLSANIKLKLNQKQAALLDIDNAIALSTESNPEYHLTRARILVQQNRIKEAEADLEQASDLPKARQLLMALRAQQQAPASTRGTDALLEQATSLARAGKETDAIPLFNEVLKTDPTNKAALLNRGSAYGRTGKFELALNDFKAALALDQNDARTYYLIGVTYQDMNRRQEACNSYQRAVDLGWQADNNMIAYCR